VACKHLKHRFLDFTQVAFWGGQEEENEFKVTYCSVQEEKKKLTFDLYFGF